MLVACLQWARLHGVEGELMPDTKTKKRTLKVKEFPVLSFETVKFLLYIVGLSSAVMLFVWRSQAAQDAEIEVNGRAVGAVKGVQQEHLKQSTETFREFKECLTEQRKAIASTRETMSAVRATQEAIKNENGRLSRAVEKLAEEVRKANGGVP